MKKLISLITVVFFLCVSINSFAAVKDYVWSQASGTYTPITGGTVVATATANDGGAGSLDDIVYAVADGTIPFTFNYDGTGYTGFWISTNGFITFGLAPATNNYTPLSNAALYPGAISALGGDNNSLFNINGNTGEIRYETVGSEFVIQWSNFRPYSSSLTNVWRWNFQIRLHSDGSIRIVYDNSFTGVVSLSSRQVGLRGPNNTFATNVDNRLITNGVHTWATSVEGTTNASTAAQSITNIPVSGQTFIWTPPAPPVANDVGVSAATVGTPIQIISVGKAYDLTATVKNFGTAPQSNVPVYYDVNGSGTVGPVSTSNTPILQNGTENVVFSGGNAFIATVAGIYTVRVWTLLGSDEHPSGNDTLTITVNAQQKIASYPYIQTFTNPVNWTIVVENVVGTTQLWGLGICTNPDGKSPDTAATANCYNVPSGRREILRSPEMDISALSNPKLNFYVAYRTYTNGENDSMDVVLSTDGGVTFFSASTVYQKSQNTVPSLATILPGSASFFPDSEKQWRHETIDLSNVAGSGNLVIGFRSISDFGNRQWIDNVIVDGSNAFCTDAVSAPGPYNCNPLLGLNFNTIGLRPVNSGTQADYKSGITDKPFSDNNIVGYFASQTGNTITVSGNQTDNPTGGEVSVTQYTNVSPGLNIATNTTATAPDGTIFTPSTVFADYWFRVTYTGNDYLGYANYDVSIDLTTLFFSNPDALYIMKRTDQTGAWKCVSTTRSGTILTASGLDIFSDFAIGGNDALPVELASFVASTNANSVTLNWSTTTETNNAGFDIERSAANGSWTKVANVAGNGTTTSPHSYSYTDRNIATGNYSYRLKQIDFNGNFEYFNLSNEVIVGIPTKYDLSQNYPNPFNPSTSIAYEIPFDGKVSLRIFDMAGKEVATLVNEVKTAGYYTYNFNASNLSSGVYFYSLSANNFAATKKMMLLK